MANENIKIDVSVTGLDVPLMIIVDEDGFVKCFEHGKKVEGIKAISFKAKIDEMPVVEMERYVRKKRAS